MPFLLDVLGPGGLFLLLWFGSLLLLTALVQRLWPERRGTERGLPDEAQTSQMRWRDR